MAPGPTPDSTTDFRSLDFDRLWAGRDTTTSVERALLADLLSEANGARILEVGTGTGRLTPVLRERAGEYVGLDLHPEFLDRLPWAPGPSRSMRVAADARHAPFVDGSFSVVVVVRVYNFFPEPREFLREAFRLLAPGGCLLIGYQPHPSIATLIDDYRMFLNGERKAGAPSLTFSRASQVPARPGQFIAWLPTRRLVRTSLAEAGLRLERSLSSGVEDYAVASRFPARLFIRLAEMADGTRSFPNQFLRSRKGRADDPRSLPDWDSMVACPKCRRPWGPIDLDRAQALACPACGKRLRVDREWLDAGVEPEPPAGRAH